MPFVPHAKSPSRQVSQVPLVAAAICRKRDLASARVANADLASVTAIPPARPCQNKRVKLKSQGPRDIFGYEGIKMGSPGSMGNSLTPKYLILLVAALPMCVDCDGPPLLKDVTKNVFGSDPNDLTRLPVAFGDFNGDKMTDLFVLPHSNGN